MKYILLLIMTLLSVYSASEAVANSTKWKEWWKKRPLKGLGFWIALLLSGLTMYCTWKDDDECFTPKRIVVIQMV